MIKTAIFDVQYVTTSEIEMFTQLFLNPFQAATLDLM